MIILSNSIAQTVLPGQSVMFDTVVLKHGNTEMHRPNSPAITCCNKGCAYKLDFCGNIGATAAATQAQINIAYDQAPLPETTAISVTAADGDLNNVAVNTVVRNDCCCCGRISVINTGTTSITIGANPKLQVGPITQ